MLFLKRALEHYNSTNIFYTTITVQITFIPEPCGQRRAGCYAGACTSATAWGSSSPPVSENARTRGPPGPKGLGLRRAVRDGQAVCECCALRVPLVPRVRCAQLSRAAAAAGALYATPCVPLIPTPTSYEYLCGYHQFRVQGVWYRV